MNFTHKVLFTSVLHLPKLLPLCHCIQYTIGHKSYEYNYFHIMHLSCVVLIIFDWKTPDLEPFLC